MGIEYFKDLANPLTREEEVKYGRQAMRGIRAAKHKLILHNMRLAIKIAAEYLNCGVDLEELVSESFVGLTKAADHFNPDRGIFSFLAQFYIRNSLRTFISERSRIIRRPTSYVDDVRLVKRTREKLSFQFGREPTLNELKQATKLGKKTLKWAMKPQTIITSMDAPVHVEREREGIHDMIPDEQAVIPNEQCDEFDTARYVRDALGGLKPRHRRFLKMRFGIGCNPRTLEWIAQKNSISRERVRQIESDAICALRKIMRNHEPIIGSGIKARDLTPRYRRTECRCGNLLDRGAVCMVCSLRKAA